LAKIINTANIDPKDLSPQEREWVYNGMDCCITAELLEVLEPQLDNQTAATYAFSRELQGPILEMRLRGVRIDQARRHEVIEEYFWRMEALEAQLQKICGEAFNVWELNWRPNSRDLPYLFYDVLEIPPITYRGRPTCDRAALEKLSNYFIAKPIVDHIILLRELMKKIGVLKTEIDKDGRMRTSYNIAGTTTGRLSSSFSEFGTGTNLQNIEESLRSVFIADRGYKLAYLDAQQGESRIVGAIEHNLFGDDRYLDACEGGDLHTRVAQLTWPDLPWTGRLEEDRKLADRKFYRHYSRRFMCKKIGHGTNYGGKPATLSSQTKIDIKLIKDFQPKYFAAFPAHQAWHQEVQRQLYETGHQTTLTGRKRWFLGKRDDDATLREAIAYDPQGSLADILNRGMLEVWRRRDCQLLMQIHDAILIQYPEGEEDRVIPKVLRALEFPIELRGKRRFRIPYEVKTGWNWGEFNDENPEGLKDYHPGDSRRRRPEVSILDREFRSVHRLHGKQRRL
jgi:DNA polymerase I